MSYKHAGEKSLQNNTLLLIIANTLQMDHNKNSKGNYSCKACETDVIKTGIKNVGEVLCILLLKKVFKYYIVYIYCTKTKKSQVYILSSKT